MENWEESLRRDEQVTYRLRALYRRHGYRLYKVNKFEEYDLYARNKRFLVSDSVLTFTDTDGRLMALKPDVTLSIVKHARDEEPALQKFFYNETVYRPGGGCGFREIPQAGLECIGSLDLFAEGEVVMLAARSLEAVSPRHILDLSHLGLLGAVLEAAPAAARGPLLRCIGEKNLHELRAVAAEAGVDEAGCRRLADLAALHGTFAETLPQLPAVAGEAAAPYIEELQQLRRLLEAHGVADCVRLDFSTVSDPGYYNGVVFRGYVDGVPEAILSGGRYDNLVRRLGKGHEAMGFAVYLDQLERFVTPPAYDVDVVLLYDDGEDPLQVLQAARLLGDGGKSVRAERHVPAAIAYRQLVQLRNGRLEILETNH